MTQTKKVLAILLAVLMLALSVPFAAAAEGSDTWMMTAITDNTKGVNEANLIVFRDPDGLEADWVEKDESIGRWLDGWWFGVKFTAPSAAIVETATFTMGSDETRYSFKENKEDNTDWMGLWAFVNEEKAQNALKTDGLLNFTLTFYNDDSDTTGQIFTIKIDVNNIILKKDGEVVMRTVAAKDATCTENGNIAYYIDADGKYYKLGEDNVFTEIDFEDTVVEAPGHEYEYTPNYDGTHTVTCENCDYEVANVACSGGTATCTEQAVCEDCGVSYGDALGHAINGSTINWIKNEGEAGGYTAYAFCTRCKETLEAEALFEPDSSGSATCENPASGHYYVEISGTRYFKPETETNGSALGHVYRFDSFVWSADNTTAQAKLICSRCEDEKLETATVTFDAHEATCTENAYTVYTATYGSAEPESKTVTAENTKLGHKYDNGEAVYNNDNATHNKICDRCGEPSDPVACFSDAETGWSGNTATCTEPGKEYRTCPVCDHQYERDTEALGHNYGAVTHFDPDSNNYVKAQVPCSRCDGITERKPVELSETPATCSKTGLKLWFVKFDNAVFNDEGKDYYTVKTETIPINPEAHDYAFKGFTWTDGENGTATAVANFVCNNNSAHTQMPAATVEKDEAASVAPTCAAAGKNVYNASVTFEDETYTTGTEAYPAHEVTLAKEPHVYGDPNWSWNNDKTGATATFTCANCTEEADGHSVPETATVVRSEAEGDTVAQTCTNDGSHKMIATVTFEEKDYTDDETVTDLALGHDFTPDAARINKLEGNFHNWKCVRCEVYGVMEGETAVENGTVACTEGDWKTSADGHWKECTVCGDVTTASAAHTPKETFEANETQHWIVCSVCGYITTAAADHAWEWVVDQKATCIADGTKHQICTVCGETKNENTAIPMRGHDLDDGFVDPEPTCTEPGVKTFTCRNITADDEYEACTYTETATVQALGHSFTEYVSNKDATCEEDGTMTAICDRDGCDETDTIADPDSAIGHDYSVCQKVDNEQHVYICQNDQEHIIYADHDWVWGEDNYVAPTYTARGHYDEFLYCEGCGFELYRETYYIDSIPHDHNYISKVTKEANCKEEGVKTFTCTICGDVQQESIPVDSSKHADKDSDGYCSRCGADLSADARCKQCGKIHNGGFFDRLTAFFHRIAYFFTHLFG